MVASVKEHVPRTHRVCGAHAFHPGRHQCYHPVALHCSTKAAIKTPNARLATIHPGRLTWNLQITHLEGNLIFQTSMIMFHVNLPGCNRNHHLVGGWTNPFEKYYRQIGSSPQGSGWKWTNIWNHHLENHHSGQVIIKAILGRIFWPFWGPDSLTKLIA